MTSLILAAALLLQGPASTAGKGTVTGRVLAADGTPAASIRVTAMEQREPGQSQGVSVHASIAQTDSAGRYRLNRVSARWFVQSPFAGGEYQIGVRGLPLGYTIKAISMSDVNLLAAPLRIASGSALSNIVVTLVQAHMELKP
jgi:hypothetical protein